MSKIDKKSPSGKSKCNHAGTCLQYKNYRKLLERYADWCSDKITKEDIKLAKLYGSQTKTLSFEKQTKLLELEKERLEAMFLFHSIDLGKEFKEVSLVERELKEKLKRTLRKKIRRINLAAKKIIDSLKLNKCI